MRELALTYAPAVRKLYSWLEDWELTLFENDATPEQLAAQRKSLRELWALRAVLRNWINPLNRPGIEEDPEKAWLPISDHEEAKLVDDHLDGALSELASLGDTLRDSFRVLYAEELEKERQRREGVQRRIEVLAAVFLVPSFIVGFYGANTWVPGEHREWGLAVMLGVMVLLTRCCSSSPNP